MAGEIYVTDVCVSYRDISPSPTKRLSPPERVYSIFITLTLHTTISHMSNVIARLILAQYWAESITLKIISLPSAHRGV